MPDSSENIIQRAIVLRENGQYEASIEVLRAAAAEHPLDARLHALLAHSLTLAKQDQAALASLNKAIHIDKSAPIVRLNLARILLKQQKPADALKVAYELHQEDSASLEVQLVLASALSATNQVDQAFRVITGILASRHDYAEALATRAVLHYRKGDLISAAEDAEMALKWKPHLAQVWILLGSIRQNSKNVPQAINAFENALRLEPNSVQALAGLGELNRLQGRMQDAVNYLDRATKLAPFDANAWTNLGTALLNIKRREDAAAAFHRALQVSPNHAEAANNLGVLAKASGAMQEAIAWFTQAIKARSSFAEAYSNLAACLNKTGEFRKAEEYFTHALSLSPDFFEALLGLGNTMAHLGRHQHAVAIYERAIKANPGSAEAHTNLGNALREIGRLEDAKLCHEHAIHLNPDFAEAYFNLGNLLKQLDCFPAAAEKYERALQIKPDFAEVHSNFGILLADAGRFEAAITSYERALATKPDFAEAHTNLGNALKDLGRLDEAELSYRNALSIDPKHRAAFDNLLFTLNYHPDKPAEDIYAEYRSFDARFGNVGSGPESGASTTASADGRLRIGYVSPAFHSHSTRHFLEPLLANHDRTAFETFAYSEQIREDEVTVRYRSYFDHWVATKGVSDDDLAKRIREDGIHILVDIAGHTFGNRLGVFARKPAPISLHWLDFGYTTGLSAIDYYLCDSWSVPEGADSLFSERPWRLPVPAFAYRPSPGIGGGSALPLLHKGHITFGTLTRSVRINHRTIRVWAEILDRVDGSVLVINSSDFREVSAQKVLASRFENAGISRERLVMGYHSPPWDVLRNMDIGLDCFPHNSGTTLFEHLYMGVPFITLASRPSVGRLGAAILHGIGHPELIAHSEFEYIEKAVSLAGDMPRMMELRSNLQRDMQNSPLMDEAGFARHVEHAYLGMWQESLQKINQVR